ncbi:MAG: head GIN domain-containing protein [Bacteroidota bacterium]
MKRSVLLLILSFLTGSLLMAQGYERRDLGSFDKLAVGQSIEVDLRKGGSPGVSLEVSGISVDKVLTRVSDGTLKIYLEKGSYKNATVKATVTFRSLESIKVSSSAKVNCSETIYSDQLTIKTSSSGKAFVQAFVGDKLTVNASSSGKAQVNSFKGDTFMSKVSSSGKVMLSGGSSSGFVGAASSSGKIEADGFRCQDATIQASSGGKVAVHVSSQLTASASSGGKIAFSGKPSLTKSVSSGGKVYGLAGETIQSAPAREAQ